MKHCLLQRQKNKNKHTCLVKVVDDWHPNVTENECTMYFDPNRLRVSIWGDDDFGMEKYGVTENDFQKLKNMVLSQEICKKMGFVCC